MLVNRAKKFLKSVHIFTTVCLFFKAAPSVAQPSRDLFVWKAETKANSLKNRLKSISSSKSE